MTHQRIILSGPTVDGAPGLPVALIGLDEATLADLPAALDPVPAAYAGVGYWRIAEPDPLPANTVETGRTVEIVEGQAKWVLTTEPAPIEPRKAEMKAALSAQRFAVETGGILVNGLPVPTDRITQDRVDQIVKAYADGDITGAVDFKAGETWVQLDETALRAIKQTGAQHIQACFTREKQLSDAIDAAADHAELDAIDIMAGWPG